MFARDTPRRPHTPKKPRLHDHRYSDARTRRRREHSDLQRRERGAPAAIAVRAQTEHFVNDSVRHKGAERHQLPGRAGNMLDINARATEKEHRGDQLGARTHHRRRRKARAAAASSPASRRTSWPFRNPWIVYGRNFVEGDGTPPPPPPLQKKKRRRFRFNSSPAMTILSHAYSGAKIRRRLVESSVRTKSKSAAARPPLWASLSPAICASSSSPGTAVPSEPDPTSYSESTGAPGPLRPEVACNVSLRLIGRLKRGVSKASRPLSTRWIS